MSEVPSPERKPGRKAVWGCSALLKLRKLACSPRRPPAMRETPIGIGQHRRNAAPRPRVRTHPKVFQHALGCANPSPVPAERPSWGRLCGASPCVFGSGPSSIRAAVPSDEIIGAGVSATCSSFVDLIRYWPVSLPQGAFLTGSCTGGIVALAGIVLAR